MAESPFALGTLIQQDVVAQLARFLTARERRIGRALTAATVDDLLTQLEADHVLPKGVDIGFAREIGTLATARIFDGIDPLQRLHTLLAGQLAALERLLHAKNVDDVRQDLQDLFVGPLEELWKTIGPVLASQLNIAISFVTTAALMPPVAAPAIEAAVLSYFFSPNGFVTIDGSTLVAPIHLERLDLGDGGTSLKGLFSQRTAERYIRDLIRVVVEAADDARYDDLRARYGAMLTNAVPRQDKYAAWCAGYASMAESAVISAVEEACQGVAAFQTNPLIAASAGTFAGTAARKATQHVFVSEIEYLKGRRLAGQPPGD